MAESLVSSRHRAKLGLFFSKRHAGGNAARQLIVTGPEKPYPELIHLECKACGRCIAACPRQVLAMGEELNARGYRFVVYQGEGCSGCGNCFYACPEPYAIRVHTNRGEQA